VEKVPAGRYDSCRRRRRIWVAVAAITVLALGLIAGGCARSPRKYRVGILAGLQVFYSTTDGFKTRMTELGYVEGRNISYDLHQTNAEPLAERAIIEQFVLDKLDLILVFPSEEAVLAKEVIGSANVPVVFCQTNIEGTGLVQSVRAPGGNVTGVRFPGPDLAVKRFEILNELAPTAKRMWVPYSRISRIVPDQLSVLRPAARKAGVTLVESPSESISDLAKELDARARAGDPGFDAILFISEPFTRTPALFLKIGEFAARRGIPVGGVQYSLQGYTTVFGVGTDNLAVGRLAAQQADKVLKGIPAGTIPVVSAESYFQLNFKAARQLGLAVSDSLLKQADEVIR
jgi:putative tryptophan/tyrosine transport system substrate-binding protein